MKRALAVLGLVAGLSAMSGAAGAQTFCVWSSPRCAECSAHGWSESGWQRESGAARAARWESREDDAYHEIFGDRPRWSGRRRKRSGKSKPKAAGAAAPAPAAAAPADAAAAPPPASETSPPPADAHK